MLVLHWSDINSPQVSRTFLGSLNVPNNAVVWIVSILPLISNSKTLGTVQSEPTTIDITAKLIFHSFFSSLAKSKYVSIISLSFIFTLWSGETAKSIRKVYFFFFFFFVISMRFVILQLVLLPLSCSTIFQFSSRVSVLISLFAFLQFYPVVNRNGKVHYSAGSLLVLLTITGSGRLPRIR